MTVEDLCALPDASYWRLRVASGRTLETWHDRPDPYLVQQVAADAGPGRYTLAVYREGASGKHNQVSSTTIAVSGSTPDVPQTPQAAMAAVLRSLLEEPTRVIRDEVAALRDYQREQLRAIVEVWQSKDAQTTALVERLLLEQANAHRAQSDLQGELLRLHVELTRAESSSSTGERIVELLGEHAPAILAMARRGRSAAEVPDDLSGRAALFRQRS